MKTNPYTKVQMKVLSKDNLSFKDCTVGKVYPALLVPKFEYCPSGLYCYEETLFFYDDIGDSASFQIIDSFYCQKSSYSLFVNGLCKQCTDNNCSHQCSVIDCKNSYEEIQI